MEHDGTNKKGGIEEVILDSSLKSTPTREGKRGIPSKYWLCTIFNMEKEEILKDLEHGTLYILGEEICPTTKKKHIQAYFEFENRVRPLEKYKHWKGHWTRRRGTREDNMVYCSKDGNYITNINEGTKLKVLSKEEIKMKSEKEKENKIIRMILEKDNEELTEWERFELCEKEIYKLMYKEKTIRAIKSKIRREEYELHIYNMCWPGDKFKDRPKNWELEKKITMDMYKKL